MTTSMLPLFPLNTILLPGLELPLHIFEERYKAMLQDVLQNDRRFGVILAKRDGAEEVLSLVGTVAEVTHVTPREGDRFDIITIGRERFRLQDVDRAASYLRGEIVYLGDEYEASERLLFLQREVEHESRRYVAAMLTLQREEQGCVRLPDEPIALSYMVAGIVAAIGLLEAQSLLEAAGVEERFIAELVFLRREIAILERMETMSTGSYRASPN